MMKPCSSADYNFNSFGTKGTPTFLQDYNDLFSDEKIQEEKESYCGVYCLIMIYMLIEDLAWRIQ